MEFEIHFYEDEKGNSPIEDFLLEIGKSNRILVAQIRKEIKKLRYKIYHKEPLSKYIESGIWELRIKSRTDIVRVFYTFSKGKVIILLHGFIKKKQKTPIKELEIVRKRLKEIQAQEVN